jgi:hypothetical protein
MIEADAEVRRLIVAERAAVGNAEDDPALMALWRDFRQKGESVDAEVTLFGPKSKTGLCSWKLNCYIRRTASGRQLQRDWQHLLS